MGNYKDNRLQTLSEAGNGNYAYIDNLSEARRFLIKEFGSSMYAVARDVKLQVEFNPKKVAAYRLIGYESRLLNDEDFENDKVDAAEIGVEIIKLAEQHIGDDREGYRHEFLQLLRLAESIDLSDLKTK